MFLFFAVGLSGYFLQVVADRANFHGFFNVQLALDRMHRHGYRRPTLIASALNNRIFEQSLVCRISGLATAVAKKDRCESFIPRENVNVAEFSDWLYRNEPDYFSFTSFDHRDMARGSWKTRRISEPSAFAWTYR